MKTKFKKSLFLKLRSVLMLFALFICFHAVAQEPPAANIKGPLRAKAGGDNIFITTEVAADTIPVVTFFLVNNTSGAVIVSQGKYVYNPASGTGKQIAEINPGTMQGGFIIRSETVTRGGKAASGMSVSVIKE